MLSFLLIIVSMVVAAYAMSKEIDKLGLVDQIKEFNKEQKDNADE